MTMVALLAKFQRPRKNVLEKFRRFADGGTSDGWQIVSETPASELPDAPWVVESETPQYGALQSAYEGAKAGLTANFSDELGGASAASGVPRNLPSYAGNLANLAYKAVKPTIGAARLAYEHLTGQPGPATEEYNKAVDEIRARQEAMKAQHPYAYGAGEIGGGLASLAVAPEIKGATMAGRAGQAALTGAGYGALAGAGEGESTKERAENAVIGAVTGGAGAGIATPAVEALGNVLGKAARPIAGALRGSRDPEAEAAATIIAAQDAGAAQPNARTLTKAQLPTAINAGEPAMLADIGGAPTLALLRKAAETSPEARDILETALNGRLTSQIESAGTSVRDLVGGDVNSARTRAQLQAQYDAERGDAYRLAYEAGDKPIWSPELERLSSAPAVSNALRGAVSKWRNWQVIDGYGAVNPPVRVNPATGLADLNAGSGQPLYPNLQWWDYASRDLAGKASAARRAGNNAQAAMYGNLERAVKSELDKQVPEFAQARGIAAQYYGGNNAIEAGANAVADKDINKLHVTLAQLANKPAELQMFQEAYADKLASSIEQSSTGQQLVTKLQKLTTSPTERTKINAVFGPHGADKLETLLLRNQIYNMAPRALGSPQSLLKLAVTQGAQSLGMGVAGGLTGEYLGGHGEGITGFGLGAAGRFAPQLLQKAGQRAVQGIEQKVATRVAELLTSNDPGQLSAGLELAASNKAIRTRLRAAVARLSAYSGEEKGREYGTGLYGLVRPKLLQAFGPAMTQADDTNGFVRADDTNGFSRVEPPRQDLFADIPSRRSAAGFDDLVPARHASGGAVAEKHTHAQAGYHKGHGPSGSHCSICVHYIRDVPPHCRLVRAPIRPDDGCGLFEKRS